MVVAIIRILALMQTQLNCLQASGPTCVQSEGYKSLYAAFSEMCMVSDSSLGSVIYTSCMSCVYGMIRNPDRLSRGKGDLLPSV